MLSATLRSLRLCTSARCISLSVSWTCTTKYPTVTNVANDPSICPIAPTAFQFIANPPNGPVAVTSRFPTDTSDSRDAYFLGAVAPGSGDLYCEQAPEGAGLPAHLAPKLGVGRLVNSMR